MRPRHDQRGSISAWLAMTASVMVLVIGLAVDLGGQAHAQQRIRDIAGQAARVAGNQVTATQAMRGAGVSVDPVAARATATGYLAAAGVTGTVRIEAGGTTLRVTCTDTYQTVFLGMIGVNRLPVTGESTARLVRAVDGTER